MRWIGSLDNEQRALVFSRFLNQKGISHRLEIQEDTDWGSSSYGSKVWQIWIDEENQVEEAVRGLNAFIADPQDLQFRAMVSPAMKENSAGSFPSDRGSSPQSATLAIGWEQQRMGAVTRLLLATCCILYFLSEWTMPTQFPQRYSDLVLFSSPVEKALLYDYPKLYALMSRFIQDYGNVAGEGPQALPPEGSALLEKIQHTPAWLGFYPLLLQEGVQGAVSGLKEYPSFEKIREGEWWRLFSPILLHGNLLHLLFNMLWLIPLGKQLEQRLPSWRYLLFILIVAAFSNTAQYLMSGPNFLGFSGVLCGMLAFMWERQKRAAWEGYRMDRLTFLFMLIFVLGLASLQILSFFVEKAFAISLSSNMANMAHLSGGGMGWWLGRGHFFSWRRR